MFRYLLFHIGFHGPVCVSVYTLAIDHLVRSWHPFLFFFFLPRYLITNGARSRCRNLRAVALLYQYIEVILLFIFRLRFCGSKNSCYVRLSRRFQTEYKFPPISRISFALCVCIFDWLKPHFSPVAEMEDGTKSYSNAKRYFLQPQNTNVSNENKKTLQHEKVKRKKKKKKVVE